MKPGATVSIAAVSSAPSRFPPSSVRHGEKLAPVAAVVSALFCMACCLPFGIAAAAGTAGLGLVLEPIRPYLMAVSGALILFGVWQLYRRGPSCRRRNRF